MIYHANLRRQYKVQARADIKTAFWPAMGAVLLEIIPIALIAVIYEVALSRMTQADSTADAAIVSVYFVVYLLAMLFIAAPLQFGAKQYFVARARGQQVSPSLVFSCFADGKKYFTSIKLSLCILVRSLGWLALLIAATTVLCVVMIFSMVPVLDSSNAVMSTGSVLALLGSFFLVMVVSIFVSVKLRRFDGAYICMTDTPDASVWQAVCACAPIFRRHNWELFVFDLSFILWTILSAITFGIVGIYLEAYTEIAFVHYFDDLCRMGAQQETSELS